MGIPLLNYYIFKECYKYITPNIISDDNINNHTFFKYALFYDISDYYKFTNPFKIDKYNLSEKINSSKFEFFLKECIENAQEHDSNDEKLFCYYIFMSYVIKKNITPYIESMITSKTNKYYIEKMIESYYFNINDKLSIHKINLADYFYDSFYLTDSDVELLKKPIKRVFGFFCTKNYYQACYKYAQIYYEHFAKHSVLKKVLFFFYDIFINHRKGKMKAKYYMYHRKIDTKILNLNNQEYLDYDKKTINYSLDEMYKNIVKECKNVCVILNDYFVNNQNLKSFNSYFKNNHI